MTMDQDPWTYGFFNVFFFAQSLGIFWQLENWWFFSKHVMEDVVGGGRTR